MAEKRILSVNDMVRGLVRAAEFKEREEGGAIYDDDCRFALQAARARGWIYGATGSLREQLPLQVPPPPSPAPTGFILNWRQTPLGWQARVVVSRKMQKLESMSSSVSIWSKHVIDCRVWEHGARELVVSKGRDVFAVVLPSGVWEGKSTAELMREFEVWCAQIKDAPDIQIQEVACS